MPIIYANRAKAQLARTITSSDTVLSVMSGTGNLFPTISATGLFFPLTLVSVNSNDQYEIVYCISRNGDSMTIIRGQEGTSPLSFKSGDTVSLNTTASTYRRLAQAGFLGQFSQEIAQSPGGYQKGAIVCDDNPGVYWISQVDSNTTAPGSSNSSWHQLDTNNLAHEDDLAPFIETQQDTNDDAIHVLSFDKIQEVPWGNTSTGAYFHCVTSDATTKPTDVPINRIGYDSTNGNLFAFCRDGSIRTFQASGNYQPADQYITSHGYTAGDTALLNIWRGTGNAFLVNMADGSVSHLLSGDGYNSSDLYVSRMWINMGATVCVRDQNNSVRTLAEKRDLAPFIETQQDTNDDAIHVLSFDKIQEVPWGNTSTGAYFHCVTSDATTKPTDVPINRIGYDSTNGNLFAFCRDGSIRTFQASGNYQLAGSYVTGLGHSSSDRNPTNIWGSNIGCLGVNYADGSSQILPATVEADQNNAPISVIGLSQSGTPWVKNATTGAILDLVTTASMPAAWNTSGYQKLASGLIIQWGYVSTAGVFNFPITFPNFALAIIAGNADQQGAAVDNAFAYLVSKSQFYAATKSSQPGVGVTQSGITYIAIGW